MDNIWEIGLVLRAGVPIIVAFAPCVQLKTRALSPGHGSFNDGVGEDTER